MPCQYTGGQIIAQVSKKLFSKEKSSSQKSAFVSRRKTQLSDFLYTCPRVCVYLYIFIYIWAFFFHNTNQEDDLLYIQHMNLKYSTSMRNHLIAPYSNSWNTHFLLLWYSDGIINRQGLCFKALLTCYAQIWTTRLVTFADDIVLFMHYCLLTSCCCCCWFSAQR